MTARPVPWTRAERTREIGYAAAMSEVMQTARELKKVCCFGPGPDCAALPPEAAWVMGRMAAGRFMDEIIKYAEDAYLMYFDPAFLSKCAASLAEGGYGTAPAEPGGDTPEESGTGGAR